MNRQEKITERYYYLDVMRALGCLAVVLLHVSSKFTLETVGSFNYWFGIILDSTAQFAVPLFVMISGALFLNESYELTCQKLFAHIKKLLIFFFGWSFIFCLVFTVLKNLLFKNQITVESVLFAIISGPYHLWFIPMMIGIYLIIPLLRLWVTKANKKLVEYFLILGLIFTVIIPGIKTLLSYTTPEYLEIINAIDGLYFHYSSGYVIYFVLGWYLHTFEIKNKHIIYITGILGLILSIFGTYEFTVWKNDTSFFFNNFSITIFLYSASVFTYLKSKFFHVNTANKMVEQICNHSMGIYAMHIAVFPLFTYVLSIKNAAIAIPVEF